MSEKKLFKYYLNEHQKYTESRPEFHYRVNRWRFNTLLRRPYALAPWYMFGGYFFKGVAAYFVYYIFFKSTPFTKHWNREGYFYDDHHKTPNSMT